MKNNNKRKKNSPYLQTIFFGIISLASFIILFVNEEWVMENFTKGKYYVVYPILTAFWFSLVHGSFASYLLRVLGLEARMPAKKTVPECKAR